jgi:NAD(P)-dependent dehydrogenase (short-subunit alcohol dehydrogenase family)
MTHPVAIITAATQGIGEGFARELAAAGYRVVLFARTERVHELAAELGGTGVQGSLTEPDDLGRLVDTTIDTYGRIDALVNGGGHAANSPELLDVTDDDWHAGLDMVLLSVVRLARLVTPHMEAAGHGAIVNLSSYTAAEPLGFIPVNSAMRAALSSFTKLYADRYAAAGLRMNAILPGYVDNWPADEATLAQIPAGRFATVAEVAKLARFLVSDDAAYINGQSVRIDGAAGRSVSS